MKHSPFPWVTRKSQGRWSIHTRRRRENWGLTGIECRPQINGSGKRFGPPVLVSEEEAEGNAKLIAKIPRMRSELETGIDLAESVAGNWENGADLAKAVRNLMAWAEKAKKVLK